MVRLKERLLPYLLVIAIVSLLPTAVVRGQVSGGASAPVNVAVDQLPVFFSPYADTQLGLQYAHLFFDPLVRWDKNQKLERRLVNGWETVRSGVTRFYLKKNIQFHSGNLMHSDDIIWSFAQIMQLSDARAGFAGITAIKAVDNYSFDVHSSLPQEQILDYFSHFFILDSHFYIDQNIAMNNRQGVITEQQQALTLSGSGPYRIKRYNPALHLDIVANQHYWEQKVAIEEINFIKIKDAKSRTFALLAGDIDISESISNQMLTTLNKEPLKSVIELPSESIIFFTINDHKNPIFKQETVRKAFNLAINKEGMLNHLNHGMGSVAAVYSPFNQANKARPVYDIDQAKALLSHVKLPLELSLLVMAEQIDNNKEIITSLVNMMKRLGVKLQVTEAPDIEQWNNNFFAYDFTLSSWHTPLINSDNIYHDLFANSILSGYFSALFHQQDIGYTIEQQIVEFKKMQQTYQITPLLLLNKIWATDNRYNLADIFSANGIPYWHLLQDQSSTLSE